MVRNGLCNEMLRGLEFSCSTKSQTVRNVFITEHTQITRSFAADRVYSVVTVPYKSDNSVIDQTAFKHKAASLYRVKLVSCLAVFSIFGVHAANSPLVQD